MKIQRREFLTTAVAGTAGVLAAGSVAAAAPASTNPTEIVPLGKTLKACRISCGTGMGGGGRQTC